jgi:hypothetical protein
MRGAQAVQKNSGLFIWRKYCPEKLMPPNVTLK